MEKRKKNGAAVLFDRYLLFIVIEVTIALKKGDNKHCRPKYVYYTSYRGVDM